MFNSSSKLENTQSNKNIANKNDGNGYYQSNKKKLNKKSTYYDTEKSRENVKNAQNFNSNDQVTLQKIQ